MSLFASIPICHTPALLAIAPRWLPVLIQMFYKANVLRLNLTSQSTHAVHMFVNRILPGRDQ